MSPEMTKLLKNAAWENRRFVWRAVDYLARECGVTQFIDVGSGLPTVRSTHEVAQEINPDARVVYVDNDPIVLSHSQSLLAKNGNTAVVSADVRDPESILNATETRQLIDFSKPVAVLIVALFHFVTEPGLPRHVPGNASPGDIVAAFREHVAPGSYLALTHITSDDPEEVALIEDLYKSATSPVIFRSREEVTELFRGWRPLPPGSFDPGHGPPRIPPRRVPRSSGAASALWTRVSGPPDWQS